MFHDDDDRPRPAFLAGPSLFEKPEPLRRGRQGPARHYDERPVRQIIDIEHDEPQMG